MSSLKVLVAEDEYLCLMGLKSNVQKLGHKIVGEATDGIEAVKLAHETKPDIIIMDINMPIMDGIEAIKKINESLFIPSIIVSGYHDEELINRATNEGVLYYLVKPINLVDLKAAIQVTLARFKEFQELQDQLQDTKKSLEARKYIERAKGILMDRMKMSESESMVHLQTTSRNKNKKLVVVAKEIIKADEAFNIL